MLSFTDQQIHDFFAGLVTLAAVAWALYLLFRWLRRTRLDLAIGVPISVALGLRGLVAIGVSSTGAGSSLRGGDESFFLFQSPLFVHTHFLGSGWTDALTGKLYEFVFAGQIRVL